MATKFTYVVELVVVAETEENAEHRLVHFLSLCRPHIEDTGFALLRKEPKGE